MSISVFRPWLAFALLLSLAPVVVAQDDERAAAERAEQQRKEIFRAGFGEIVNDLNHNSIDRFIMAIDREDMLERVFGLRLIDPKVKKTFREDFDEFIRDIFGAEFDAAEEEGSIRAAWLGFGSRGDRGKAIVRFDLPDFQFNYHEYELRLDKNNKVIIVDFVDFMTGEKFSDGMGETLVKMSPGKNAVRKLLDVQNPSEAQVFQVSELLKAQRDLQADRFFEIYENMDEEMQGQRIAVLSGVYLTRAVRDRRKMRTALKSLAEYFPDEPLYSLMLLDYYFPTRQYEKAMESLLRLQRRLGVKDSAMSARLSSAALVLDDVDAAAAYAEEAVAMEPGLELGWWAALRARTANGQFAEAVAALDVLEQQFGYTLDGAGLEKDPSLGALLRSDEYGEWYVRHVEGDATAPETE